jgi:hypothetical protein
MGLPLVRARNEFSVLEQRTRERKSFPAVTRSRNTFRLLLPLMLTINVSGFAYLLVIVQ